MDFRSIAGELRFATAESCDRYGSISFRVSDSPVRIERFGSNNYYLACAWNKFYSTAFDDISLINGIDDISFSIIY